MSKAGAPPSDDRIRCRPPAQGSLPACTSPRLPSARRQRHAPVSWHPREFPAPGATEAPPGARPQQPSRRSIRHKDSPGKIVATRSCQDSCALQTRAIGSYLLRAKHLKQSIGQKNTTMNLPGGACKSVRHLLIRPFQNAEVAILCSSACGAGIPGTPFAFHPAENREPSIGCSTLACKSIPWTPIGTSPHQDVQMALAGRSSACAFVPGAFALAGPHEQPEVPCAGSSCAGALIPRAAVLSRILQHIEMT